MQAADLFPFRHEIRAGTLQAVRNLPEAHLEWKPPGAIHSILGWLKHIAEVEDWWVQTVVRGEPIARRRKFGGAEEVLGYLRDTRAATEELLQALPAERLEENRAVPQSHRGPLAGRTVSLHGVFEQVFRHELHHRGQIYLYLRLMGIEPPPFQ